MHLAKLYFLGGESVIKRNARNSFYDGYLYVFGKGRSQTTVSAPLATTTITQRQSVVIQGTVTDLSPRDLGTYSNPTARTD